MIQHIETHRLYPHPRNPRIGLGDLTELTASVRSTGIMQPLTVIPSDIEGYRAKIASKKKYTDTYTIIIGHRRAAAAEKAGLGTVPCIIADMDEKTQISAMMQENMQRSNFTPYEEAQGLQMMLDIGMTLEEVTKETGLSERTVYRRRSLLSLDKRKFAAANERGATLSDYLELEKIKDQDRKNKVLDTIGTKDFGMELQKHLREERDEKNAVKTLETIKSFAKEIHLDDVSNDMRITYVSKIAQEYKEPMDADEVKYFYVDTDKWYFRLYHVPKAVDDQQGGKQPEKTPKQLEREQAEVERRERCRQLTQLADDAHQLRRQYIENISERDVQHNLSLLVRFFFRASQSDGCYIELDLCRLVRGWGYEPEDRECITPDSDVIKKKIEEAPLKTLLAVSHYMLDPGGFLFHDNNGAADEDSMEAMCAVYTAMSEIGYEPSDDELHLLYGTHELFSKE